MYDVEVQVRVRRMRLAKLWIAMMTVARFVVGTERAYRWALNGAMRLVRFEILKPGRR